MAKEKAEKKEKKKPESKKKLDISAVAVIDNIVFSNKETWAYYKITNQSYDFLSQESQIVLMQKITNAFNNLMSDKKEPLQGHMVITSTPIDIELWQEQIVTLSEDWGRAPGFDNYMKKLKRFLEDSDYTEKVVYIGFMLGKRGALNTDNINPFEQGFKGSAEFISEWLKKALLLPTGEISESEEQESRQKEDIMYRNLSIGHLRASRVTAEELLLLMKRQFYPSMPAPYLDVDHDTRLGEGDIAIETSSVIENEYRWLRMEQMIGEHQYQGYRATLSMSKFPKEMDFPRSMPFLYFIQKLTLPFTTFSRFELLPSAEVKKLHDKKTKEQVDEVENAAAGIGATQSVVSGTPDHIREGLEAGQEIGSLLNQDKSAWFRGSFFVVVETPTEEFLRKYVNVVKQYYADHEININWTSGDQAMLFLAQMPGDRHRMSTFDQLTTLNMLSTSGFNFSSDVGDPIYGSQVDVRDNG